MGMSGTEMCRVPTHPSSPVGLGVFEVAPSGHALLLHLLRKAGHGQHKWPQVSWCLQGAVRESKPSTLWQPHFSAPSAPNFPLITLWYPIPTIPPFSKYFPCSLSRVIFSPPARRGHWPSAGITKHHELPRCCPQIQFPQGACCKAGGTPLK